MSHKVAPLADCTSLWTYPLESDGEQPGLVAGHAGCQRQPPSRNSPLAHPLAGWFRAHNALRADMDALASMLQSFEQQLDAGTAISRSQAAAATRFVQCFLKFLHHHHHNEDGELRAAAAATPGSALQPQAEGCLPPSPPHIDPASSHSCCRCCRRHRHALPGHPLHGAGEDCGRPHTAGGEEGWWRAGWDAHLATCTWLPCIPAAPKHTRRPALPASPPVPHPAACCTVPSPPEQALLERFEAATKALLADSALVRSALVIVQRKELAHLKVRRAEAAGLACLPLEVLLGCMLGCMCQHSGVQPALGMLQCDTSCMLTLPCPASLVLPQDVFAALQSMLLEHLREEEEEAMPLMRRHFTPKEIERNVVQKIMRSMDGEGVGAFLRPMSKAERRAFARQEGIPFFIRWILFRHAAKYERNVWQPFQRECLAAVAAQ